MLKLTRLNQQAVPNRASLGWNGGGGEGVTCDSDSDEDDYTIDINHLDPSTKIPLPTGIADIIELKKTDISNSYTDKDNANGCNCDDIGDNVIENTLNNCCNSVNRHQNGEIVTIDLLSNESRPDYTKDAFSQQT